MKKNVQRALWILGMILVSNAPSVYAQSSNFSYEAVAHAPVGAWAEYTISFKGKDEKKTQRYALVERTPQRLVLEIETGMSIGNSIMHLEYVPSGSDGWVLFSGKIRMANGQTAVLPTSGENTMIKKGAAQGTMLGKESLKTAVGIVDCKHWVKQTQAGSADVVAEFWTSDALFPVGLVKSAVATQGIEVSLASVGIGATAKIP